MSPEQLRGEEVDTRTDLFSFGLVLYEMATGRPAFAGSRAVVGAAILHQPPTPLRTIRPEVPDGFEQVVLKALEKDRQLRYQTAADLYDKGDKAKALDLLMRILSEDPEYPFALMLKGLIEAAV